MERWRDRWGLLICLLVAFAVRSTACVALRAELTRDRDAYLALAHQVAQGHGLVSPEGKPTAFRPPLYPLQLALLEIVLPEVISVAVVNLFWSGITVVATWFAARALGLGRGAFLAALLTAIDPMLVWYSVQPMTEVMCAGLVALLVLACVTCDRPQREWGIGIVFGALVLCRPTFWPLAGLALIAWLIRRMRVAMTPFPWRMVVATLGIVAPWVLRNLVVMGTPILMSTHGGYTLLLANNAVFYDKIARQGWNAEWDAASFEDWQRALQQELSQLGPEATEQDRDRWQNGRARQVLRDHPDLAVQAAWHRVCRLWSPIPREASSNPTVRAVVGFYYVPLLLAFAVGFVVKLTDRRWQVLLFLVVTVQSVHLLYWTNARMRAPLVPVIGLLATIPVSRCRLSRSPERPSC